MAVALGVATTVVSDNGILEGRYYRFETHTVDGRNMMGFAAGETAWGFVQEPLASAINRMMFVGIEWIVVDQKHL